MATPVYGSRRLKLKLYTPDPVDINLSLRIQPTWSNNRVVRILDHRGHIHDFRNSWDKQKPSSRVTQRLSYINNDTPW